MSFRPAPRNPSRYPENLIFAKTGHQKSHLFFHQFLISILVNQYYGFIGVNPIDNFTIYHSGNLILEGKKPFQDFYIFLKKIDDPGRQLSLSEYWVFLHEIKGKYS